MTRLCRKYLDHHERQDFVGSISRTSANPLFRLDVSDQNVNKKSDSVTFHSLTSRLIKLLICALENEVDSHNTQLLLGGLSIVWH